jgi:hypothetical protein
MGKSSGTHCRRGWVVLMADLGRYGKEKNLLPTVVQHPGHPTFTEWLHLTMLSPPLVSIMKIKYKTLLHAYFKAMTKLNPKFMSFNSTVLTPYTLSFVRSNTVSNRGGNSFLEQGRYSILTWKAWQWSTNIIRKSLQCSRAKCTILFKLFSLGTVLAVEVTP